MAVATDPRQRMQSLSEGIPRALAEMDLKQGATAQVIEWCESEYRTGDKRRVISMTKEYLTDALMSITTDVGSLAQQITESMDAQVRAPESVSRAGRRRHALMHCPLRCACCARRASSRRSTRRSALMDPRPWWSLWTAKTLPCTSVI